MDQQTELGRQDSSAANYAGAQNTGGQNPFLMMGGDVDTRLPVLALGVNCSRRGVFWIVL
jgi:hypothetical protein